ncbi:hypothetical protein ACFL2V_05900 [Pseudomonadota bacterium]
MAKDSTFSAYDSGDTSDTVVLAKFKFFFVAEVSAGHLTQDESY